MALGYRGLIIDYSELAPSDGSVDSNESLYQSFQRIYDGGPEEVWIITLLKNLQNLVSVADRKRLASDPTYYYWLCVAVLAKTFHEMGERSVQIVLPVLSEKWSDFLKFLSRSVAYLHRTKGMIWWFEPSEYQKSRAATRGRFLILEWPALVGSTRDERDELVYYAEAMVRDVPSPAVDSEVKESSGQLEELLTKNVGARYAQYDNAPPSQMKGFFDLSSAFPDIPTIGTFYDHIRQRFADSVLKVLRADPDEENLEEELNWHRELARLCLECVSSAPRVPNTQDAEQCKQIVREVAQTVSWGLFDDALGNATIKYLYRCARFAYFMAQSPNLRLVSDGYVGRKYSRGEHEVFGSSVRSGAVTEVIWPALEYDVEDGAPVTQVKPMVTSLPPPPASAALRS